MPERIQIALNAFIDNGLNIKNCGGID